MLLIPALIPCGAAPVEVIIAVFLRSIGYWSLEESEPVGALVAKKAKGFWSGEVTRRSNALDLDDGVFTWHDPKKIAASLKRSADRSRRRKGTPYQSAMSMLTFYINRAGRNLDRAQRAVLEQAKHELRAAFGRA
jgi:hypothetical protein